MALGKNTAKINFKGGGTLYLNTDINETELPGGTPTKPWDDMGYLAEDGTQFTDETESEEVRDETGELLKILEKNRAVKIITALLQTGKDEIDYINNNRDTDLQAYYEVSVEDGAKTQKWHFPKVRIIPKIDLTFNTSVRKLPIEIHVLKKDAGTDYYTVTEA